MSLSNSIIKLNHKKYIILLSLLAKTIAILVMDGLNMKDTEKAYIAGIIDGEGSIMLQRIHSNEHPSPCVSIASTTYELLEWIKNIIGKGMIIKIKILDLKSRIFSWWR